MLESIVFFAVIGLVHSISSLRIWISGGSDKFKDLEQGIFLVAGANALVILPDFIDLDTLVSVSTKSLNIAAATMGLLSIAYLIKGDLHRI